MGMEANKFLCIGEAATDSHWTPNPPLVDRNAAPKVEEALTGINGGFCLLVSTPEEALQWIDQAEG
ncbi:MAG: hypothetical protein DCO99_04350 [Synechococcus sp. XM-24]|jgi:hypothetical protein|nr:MAG: hypothetical protein DCO99_04350 [Synechococcus sp. XM-24]